MVWPLASGPIFVAPPSPVSPVSNQYLHVSLLGWRVVYSYRNQSGRTWEIIGQLGDALDLKLISSFDPNDTIGLTMIISDSILLRDSQLGLIEHWSDELGNVKPCPIPPGGMSSIPGISNAWNTPNKPVTVAPVTHNSSNVNQYGDDYHKKIMRNAYGERYLEKPKCECGAHTLGVGDYAMGHSDWCAVHHGKRK